MMNNEPFFSCQNEECACEISYPHHMLNLWNDEPICEECYTRLGGDLPWSDLPSFVPQFQKTIESQAAEIERLRSALERVRVGALDLGDHFERYEFDAFAAETICSIHDEAEAALNIKVGEI